MTDLTAMTNFAQLAVERVVNSLPEGVLLAGCAWFLLRLLSRQNAGTRFAVWLVTLIGVAGLPLLSAFELGGHSLRVAPHAEVTVPALWAVVLLAVWACVTLFAFARLAAGVLQVRRIRTGCTEVDLDQLEPMLREVIQQSGERRVRLVVSDNAQIPAAIGFRNPAIVLPAWALREMSADQLKPILIHEMAHLRRRDDWTNLLQKAVRAFLFFHPAIWWIDARLSLEREMACDDAVLAATGNAPAYAGSLIGLLERGCERRGWKMAQAAVARAKEATLRIARILESGSATTRVGRGALGLAAVLCMTCFGVLEIAPQFVAFAPDTDAPVAQSVMPTADFPSHSKANVVPAMFHPAEAEHHPVPIHHKPTRPHKAVDAAARQLIAAQPMQPRTPPVVMAKLDAAVPQPTAKPVSDVQVLMVVQTSLADLPAGAVSDGVVDPAAVSAQRAVRVQTIQVLEQDETGWHVHLYRTVTVLPLPNGEPMHSSI